MRTRFISVLAAGAALLVLAAPTAGAQEIPSDLHPCHEYAPQGDLVEWAQRDGFNYAWCMGAYIMK